MRELAVIEGTTSLEWLTPTASVMVATDPGRRWKEVALRYVGACDIVLRNRVPVAPGDIAAPEQFLAAQPLDCDLARRLDPGTAAYVSRLQSLCGVTVAQRSPAASARSGN